MKNNKQTSPVHIPEQVQLGRSRWFNLALMAGAGVLAGVYGVVVESYSWPVAVAVGLFVFISVAGVSALRGKTNRKGWDWDAMSSSPRSANIASPLPHVEWRKGVFFDVDHTKDHFVDIACFAADIDVAESPGTVEAVLRDLCRHATKVTSPRPGCLEVLFDAAPQSNNILASSGVRIFVRIDETASGSRLRYVCTPAGFNIFNLVTSTAGVGNAVTVGGEFGPLGTFVDVSGDIARYVMDTEAEFRPSILVWSAVAARFGQDTAVASELDGYRLHVKVLVGSLKAMRPRRLMKAVVITFSAIVALSALAALLLS